MVDFSTARNASKASELRSMRSVVGAVLSGTARKRVLFLADSTTAAQIGGGGGSAGARAKSPPSIAAKLLQGAGIDARADAVFGNAAIGDGTTATYSAYNPDVTFGAGWAPNLTSPVAIAGGFWSNSTTTSAMVFTPQKAADRFDLYYIKAGGSGNGTLTVTDASGTLATIDTNVGTYGLYKTTITRAVADRAPISIQRNGTGAAIYVGAIDPWNSTLPELCMLNAARSSGQAVDILSNGAPYQAKLFVDLIAADLHYIEYGLNDKNTGVALSTFQTSLHAGVTNCKLLGGVMLGVPTPATLGDGFNLTSDWRDAIAAEATASGVALIDHYSRFVSREAAAADYSDQVHLTFTGYAIKGRAIFDTLVS